MLEIHVIILLLFMSLVLAYICWHYGKKYLQHVGNRALQEQAEARARQDAAAANAANAAAAV